MYVPQLTIEYSKLYLSLDKQIDDLLLQRKEVEHAIIDSLGIEDKVAHITENSDHREHHEQLTLYGNDYISHQVPIPETPLVVKWLTCVNPKNNV